MKKNLRHLLIILMFSGVITAKAQVPLHSSYPSASAVVFLDFDGQTVNNFNWSATPIVCGPAGLNTAQMTEVFNRVAEDYRPFNLNVTTDSTLYLAAPPDKRMRVIVTVSFEWYGPAGGVAWVGSFNWGDDTPCFVFSSQLSFTAKYVAEATSHEAGHTLGLFHQSTYNGSCVKTAEYNPGTGSGEIGWAPIMGVGYSKNQTTWNNGPNSNGCNNMQSDLEIITDIFTNGFTYRNDDHASNFAGATNVPFVSNAFNTTGDIEQNTDADYIKFTTTAYGRFQLNAIPVNVGANNSGSNLDIQVSLYNNSQVLLNVYNPATLLSASIDSFINAGTYYLKVEGRGNMYAPNYASLGSYSLQGTFTGGALPLRKLELQGKLQNDQHQLTWIIDADEQVTKQVLEVSTNSRNFTPITESPVTTRSYAYNPHTSGTIQYRLSVTFDNGRQYYSNIVTLRKNVSNPGPKLVTTFVNGNDAEVTSPGVYSYFIYDLNGRTMAEGRLSGGSNSIKTGGLNGGMYIVRFTDGNTEWLEKLIKQ